MTGIFIMEIWPFLVLDPRKVSRRRHRILPWVTFFLLMIQVQKQWNPNEFGTQMIEEKTIIFRCNQTKRKLLHNIQVFLQWHWDIWILFVLWWGCCYKPRRSSLHDLRRHSFTLYKNVIRKMIEIQSVRSVQRRLFVEETGLWHKISLKVCCQPRHTYYTQNYVLCIYLQKGDSDMRDDGKVESLAIFELGVTWVTKTFTLFHWDISISANL